MTYLRNNIEYLEPDEWTVYQAVRDLTADGRAVNNSQLARTTPYSRTKVRAIAERLARRSYLRDHAPSKAAPHWRTTAKIARPSPSVATMTADHDGPPSDRDHDGPPSDRDHDGPPSDRDHDGPPSGERPPCALPRQYHDHGPGIWCDESCAPEPWCFYCHAGAGEPHAGWCAARAQPVSA